MTPPRVLPWHREAASEIAEMYVLCDKDSDPALYDEIAEMIASHNPACAAEKENHCKDCCCARIWAAMGITQYTGMSIVEHVEELAARADTAEAALKKAEGLLRRAHPFLATNNAWKLAPEVMAFLSSRQGKGGGT